MEPTQSAVIWRDADVTGYETARLQLNGYVLSGPGDGLVSAFIGQRDQRPRHHQDSHNGNGSPR